MRISALAEATGVSVATLKYYLREGLLHPGAVRSRTQADYDETHVERVRLVRALGDVGGLDLATIRRVLATIAEPDVERVGILGAAQRSLLGEAFVEIDDAPGELDPDSPSRARRFAAARGWRIDPRDPVLDDLDAAWDACDAAGIGVDEARMSAYADATETVAEVDVASVPREPAAAVRQVVLGTVLVDPVLAALRRLAHQHVAVSRETPPS
ncbi:MerR family transcriptional regulator [Agilicoccus flavus]|uniref:MerR family transcriptional regulator n=1 Tax=Agilicoccus flavus TaxID=2775968 RepID=UPI001CF6FB64|nr:MerR family transcriptional regulator [Agilicoccus flavus]